MSAVREKKPVWFNEDMRTGKLETTICNVYSVKPVDKLLSKSFLRRSKVQGNNLENSRRSKIPTDALSPSR